MSDFAALLKQLDKSAKRASETSGSKDEDRDEKQRRKRPRTETVPVPRDHDELRIRLSFLCIGAQKGGTTWLHEMLRSVPGLGLPAQKELHFWDWHRRKGLGWYSRQFPFDRDLLYGEVTPCYAVLPDRDIREIRRLFPSVRIIFLARDLVERAWSAMTMELRNSARGMEPGEFHAKRDAMDAQTRNRIQRESDPDSHPDSYFLGRLHHATHADRSDYVRGLRRWLVHFPKEQLLILDYRRIASDPKKLMEQTLRHFGVQNVETKVEALGDELGRRVNTASDSSVNVSPKPIRPGLRHEMESYLRPFAKAFNELLKDLGYDWTVDEYE